LPGGGVNKDEEDGAGGGREAGTEEGEKEGRRDGGRTSRLVGY